ncbi:unnamed protein product [Lampetra fluviatilis]
MTRKQSARPIEPRVGFSDVRVSSMGAPVALKGDVKTSSGWRRRVKVAVSHPQVEESPEATRTLSSLFSPEAPSWWRAADLRASPFQLLNDVAAAINALHHRKQQHHHQQQHHQQQQQHHHQQQQNNYQQHHHHHQQQHKHHEQHRHQRQQHHYQQQYQHHHHQLVFNHCWMKASLLQTVWRYGPCLFPDIC